MLAAPAMAKPTKKTPKKKTVQVTVEINQLSPEQLSLNEKAAKATQEKDFQRAETLFLANLELGEFDITWLNLGRTYAKQGKCLEARNAYSHVLTAPKLTEDAANPLNIEEKLERFQQELNEQCADQVARVDRAGSEGGFFSEEQLSLNARAAEATNAGDYEQAELLFRANLRLGEFDITWLNLGRTYARHGKCIEAREAYSHVLDAPIQRENANIKIEEILGKYQGELQDECKDEFVEYDHWHENSQKWVISGWTLVGVGAAGIVASVIMIAADMPSSSNPYDEFVLNANGEYLREYKTESGESYNELDRAYKRNVKILKYTPLGVGAAIALTGAGLLIAEHLKFKKYKLMESEQNEAGVNEQTGSTASQWSPTFSISPAFTGAGLKVSF